MSVARLYPILDLFPCKSSFFSFLNQCQKSFLWLEEFWSLILNYDFTSTESKKNDNQNKIILKTWLAVNRELQGPP